MNQSNSQVRSSDSEDHQPSPSSDSYNPQDTVSSHDSNGDACHVTYAAQTIGLPVQINHPTIFFFRPPNDRYHYHINCEEISCDTIERLLNKSHIQSNENECIFFYQQRYNNRFYQVSCEIVSPLLVNNCLNKIFLGFELQQQNTEEYLAFTVDRKEKLQFHLKLYLSQYVLVLYEINN